MRLDKTKVVTLAVMVAIAMSGIGLATASSGQAAGTFVSASDQVDVDTHIAAGAGCAVVGGAAGVVGAVTTAGPGGVPMGYAGCTVGA